MESKESRSIPKDAQVIHSILKDMGIQEYENRVVNQLLDFAYRYVTTVLGKPHTRHSSRESNLPTNRRCTGFLSVRTQKGHRLGRRQTGHPVAGRKDVQQSTAA